MQGLKDFEAVLSVMPMDDEKKKQILEKSKVFFEYQEFLTKKHGISKEAAEQMSNVYVHDKLSKDDEAMEKIVNGDMTPLCELVEQFAKEQGFDKPLAESMMTFMNFYKEMGSEI